ncbi:MAG: cobalamin biosynthesis protein CbiD [Lachnospiraceae bacterium]|nr:cobalamin biosynthesis protein CbiD [Lachnospiraceae bacterium]
MRMGFTTGSAACAAALASAYLLIAGIKKSEIELQTPKGLIYKAKIMDPALCDSYAECGVIKDGGDDPDITSGLMIKSRVEFAEDGKRGIFIKGGEGVGRVTKPGLDQPVGEAAINSVPRRMITEALIKVLESFDEKRGLIVTISVPGGEEVAKKTFNPKLGIEGGISIIGTSGVVEPMSTRAILDTIGIELHQRHVMGDRVAFVSPGNYGQDFFKNTYGIDIDKSVKCSNYIGDTIDRVLAEGFEAMLLVGHIGKLIKVSDGTMNTHSKVSDRRMELLSLYAKNEGLDPAICESILDCVVTEEAIRLIESNSSRDFRARVMDNILKDVLFHLNDRAKNKLRIECIIYSTELGALAKSAGAEELLDLYK